MLQIAWEIVSTHTKSPVNSAAAAAEQKPFFRAHRKTNYSRGLQFFWPICFLVVGIHFYGTLGICAAAAAYLLSISTARP